MTYTVSFYAKSRSKCTKIMHILFIYFWSRQSTDVCVRCLCVCVCMYEHNMNFTCRIVCHMNNLYIGGTDMIWLLLYIDRETIHGRNEKQKKKG